MNFWNKEVELDESISLSYKSQSEETTETTEAPISDSKKPPLSENGNVSMDDVLDDLEVRLVKRFGKLQSAISSGAVIEGKLAFDSPVRIDGHLKGKISAPKALIVVGPEGNVDAEVDVAFLVIMGKVTGTVRATEKIELLSGGCLEGDIETPKFIIEDDAVFHGQCAMNRDSKESKAPPKKEQEKPKEVKSKAVVGPKSNGIDAHIVAERPSS